MKKLFAIIGAVLGITVMGLNANLGSKTNGNPYITLAGSESLARGELPPVIITCHATAEPGRWNLCYFYEYNILDCVWDGFTTSTCWLN